ncbi:MAG TPA: hypothetical protein VF666_11710 [Pyrinomonadaceae bacterium]
MARTSKKRARQLKHDKFRDTTMGVFDRVGHRMEGRGRTLLYVIAALVLAGVLAGIYSWWSGRRANEARAALGHAIEIAEAPVTPSPSPGSTAPTFPTERERAQKALEEFEKVAAKYGDPYNDVARFMAATQLLTVERTRGLSELEKIARSGNREVAARARFALAQAREADAQYDAAATLYQELLKQNEPTIAADTLNLRLASVYEKQGKTGEAADILFRMVKAAREAKGKDGKPAPQSDAVRNASEKLETLDPQRYAQLPPEPPAGFPS